MHDQSCIKISKNNAESYDFDSLPIFEVLLAIEKLFLCSWGPDCDTEHSVHRKRFQWRVTRS